MNSKFETGMRKVEMRVLTASQIDAVTGGGSAYSAKAFEIKDFSFGVENPTTIGSGTTGAGAGK
jgi:hypothetical protein